MNQRLTSSSTAALFEELTTRVLRLQLDAERPGCIGCIRTLLHEAYETGREAGIATRANECASRMQVLLDEATRRMPDVPPDGFGDSSPALAYWRDGRQSLWRLVEAEREACHSEGEIGARAAIERSRRLNERVGAALRPGPTLRQRAGRWLLSFGMRLGERRSEVSA